MLRHPCAKTIMQLHEGTSQVQPLIIVLEAPPSHVRVR
jgi:hypothetical protein